LCPRDPLSVAIIAPVDTEGMTGFADGSTKSGKSRR
jgi:hypothetical protein